MKDIHFVGKINVEIFKVITEDIQTEEVIITEERIAHIRKNHPGDYEKYKDFISEVLQNPEYIFQSDMPNTALIMNSVMQIGESCAIILRIKVADDPIDFKNSIITLMHISERKRKKYINNKKVLYKRE